MSAQANQRIWVLFFVISKDSQYVKENLERSEQPFIFSHGISHMRIRPFFL